MNSSTKKIISVVVVLVLLLLTFFIFKNKATKSTAGEGNSKVTTADKETTLKGSMFDLIKSGNTTKCTFSTKDDLTSMTGTTYVAGNKMRNDTEIKTKEGVKTESHMISDGTWIYTWTSVAPQGFKMKIEKAETPKTDGDTTTPSNNSAANLQDNYDFKCSKWSVDSSKFDIPSDITFSDFSETLKNLNKDGSLCSSCDYAQDAEAKAKCKAQLDCK